MELRHIRYFLAVASGLNFTAAAKRLNISQPPLSQQIADLERELGVKLFDRHSRNVELTAAGETFRRHAESILAQAEAATEEARAVGRGQAGVVHVAATNSVLYSGLSARVSAFRDRNPGVGVAIHELPPAEQIERLLTRRVDVCFVRFAPDEPDLVVRRAWPERVGVVVPAQHRLARQSQVRIASLKDEEFVFYRLKGSDFAGHLYASCVAQGFAPRIVQEVVEAFSVSSLVAAGLGIGFIPETLRGLTAAHYLSISGTRLSADVFALVHRNATPIARGFAASAFGGTG